MKKSIFGLGVAFAVAFTLANTQAVLASTLSDTVSHMEAAVSLVMPFDATTGHASYQLVSRKGAAVPVVATHWSFWSDSCDHLGDVMICLTDNDTVVVDPTKVQSQIQRFGENLNLGPVLDFSGSRGFITVSQFEANVDAPSCVPADRTTLLAEPSLVGSWTIADTRTNAAFGNNALGFLSTDTPQALPDATEFFTDTAGVQLQFYNPETLTDSEVIVIGIGSPAGNGEFAGVEIGPIPALLNNGNDAMCCNAEYYDNIETNISIPDLCFTCASFTAITEKLADKADNQGFLIPTSKAPKTSGFLSLTNCEAGNADGTTVNLNANASNAGTAITNGAGDEIAIFPFAFHGMAVGPFGTSASGKYTAVL